MARNVFDRLFDSTNVETGLVNYTMSTGDYNLVDRMDGAAFAPTFNAATSTIDVFPSATARRISFRLVDLFPDSQIGTVLADFADAGIAHGHIFVERIPRDLSVFYLKALKLLPPNISAQIVFWKRAAYAAEETMLPGRRQLWDLLWHHEFAPWYSFHPALFASISRYKGPIPLFLQSVHAFCCMNLGPKAMASIFAEIVCREWTINASTPRFLFLWHRIMKETAVVYISSEQDSTKASVLKSSTVGDPPSVLNTDKLLCLLLLLFHETYRNQLARILAEESRPAILADLFNRFPILEPKIS